MSISTPNPNQGKDDERETSKQNAAPPRPSARRTRRGGTAAPKSEPQAGAEGTDETVDGAELADAQATTEAGETAADAAGLHTVSDPDGDDAPGAEDADLDKDAEDEYAGDGHAAFDDEVDDAAEEAEADAIDDAEDDDEVGGDEDEDAGELALADSMPHKAPKPDRFDDTPIAQQAGRAGSFGVTGTGDTSGFGGLQIHAGSGIPARSTDRPYGGYFDEVADRFAKAYSQWRQALIATVVDRGEITFYVEKSHIARILKVARDDAELRFELLSSLSGVDYYRGEAGLAPTGDPKQDEYATQRLHVVYHLLSMTFRRRVRFEVATTVENPHVPTVTEVYPTADWQERETYDMFGVIFDGHHALTRILMPDDWDGFPQRKDYPLGGIPVEYHDATIPPPDERRAYK